MSIDTLSNPPKITTVKKHGSDILKKAISIMSIVFVLFVLPATINLALTSQDARNRAQVISDNAAVDVKTDNGNVVVNSSSNNNDSILWKVYPFALGIIVLCWVAVIFIYLGMKFSRRL